MELKQEAKTKMEQENLEQNQEKRIEPKISVSRDGRWVIIRVPGIEQPIIKSVNYIKAILENAEKKKAQVSVNAERIKG
jgi:hypothetical protein